MSRLLYWPVIAAILLLLILPVGIRGVRRVTEQRRLAALPVPGRGTPPNVLLLVWDTLRRDHLSVAGYPRRTTPGLEQLAAEGVRFRNAFAAASWTLPSHGTILTGYLEQEMVAGHRMPVQVAGQPIAEALARHGYLTAGFAGNQVYAGSEYGISRGFIHFEDYHPTPLSILAAPRLTRMFLDPKEPLGQFARQLGYTAYPWERPAESVRHDFIRWLDARPTGRPFFAFINFFDAHMPYRPPAPFDTAFGADPHRPHVLLSAGVPAELIEREEKSYDGAIAYIDHEVTNLLEQLRERGLLDRTLVIVTADHGESFGRHGIFYHSSSFLAGQLHVPLLLRWPGRVPEHQVVDATVSLRDLPATVYDLLELPDPSPFPGRSLRRFWSGAVDASRGERVIAGETTFSRRHGNAIIEGGFYYTAWPGRPERLFAFPDDSAQQHDLSGDPAYAGRMAHFHAVADSLDQLVVARRGTQLVDLDSVP
jgi:arylsulfatase A-like enzyme